MVDWMGSMLEFELAALTAVLKAVMQAHMMVGCLVYWMETQKVESSDEQLVRLMASLQAVYWEVAMDYQMVYEWVEWLASLQVPWLVVLTVALKATKMADLSVVEMEIHWAVYLAYSKVELRDTMWGNLMVVWQAALMEQKLVDLLAAQMEVDQASTKGFAKAVHWVLNSE